MEPLVMDLKRLTRFSLGFVIDHWGGVLLQVKNKPEWMVGRANGIGGKIEIGESPVQCMVREAREEIQLDSTKDDWQQFHYERHASGTCLYCYVMEVEDLAVLVEDTLQVGPNGEQFYVYQMLPNGALGQNSHLPKPLDNLHYLVPMARCWAKSDSGFYRYLEG